MASDGFTEVKTKSAAEKSVKAGNPTRIVAGKFALAFTSLTGLNIQIEAAAEIELTLTNVAGIVAQKDMWSSSVEAWGSSSVEAWGSSSVVARESSRVVAWGSSRVEAWESSSVEAWESSRVEAWESSSVVAWGSSRVEAWGSSSVVARESSRVEARESSRVEARESSSVVARGSSSVEAWESSRVEARESSRVVAWGSSSVEARESSRVVAWGYSMIQARGTRAKINATAGVAVNLWDGATAEGGRQFTVTQETPQDWCDYYGAKIEGEVVVLYKAVGYGYVSQWGATYAPGSMPKDEKWDGQKRECAAGGGLNFSPTPRHTHRFVPWPKHYLECRVLLADLVVHFDGQYPEKVCAKEVIAPLVEVDVNGDPVEAKA